MCHRGATVLQVPWPLGSTYATGPDAVPIRHHIRDPQGVLPDVPGAFRSELIVDAELPPGSTATGYSLGDVALWFGPDGGDEYAYLVRPGGVERWPIEVEPVGCA